MSADKLISNSFTVPLLNAGPQGLAINVPPVLQDTLEINRHLMPKFVTQIQKAVQGSLEHPDTRLRGDVRESEIKLRVNLCYEAIRQMYFEEKLSLIHALDILPDVIIDAIRMGDGHPGEEVAGPDGNRWSVPDEERAALVTDGYDLNAGDD